MSVENDAKNLRSGPGRLSAKDAEALPDRLLDAAASVFDELGFGEATMDKIAKTAGASTKTLYSRYANKSEILIAVANRMAERVAAAHQATGMGDPMKIEPRAFLVGLGCLVVNTIQGKDAMAVLRLVLSEMHRRPELASIATVTTGRWVLVIRDALQAWNDAGILQVRGDLYRAAQMCVSMMLDRPRLFGAIGLYLDQNEVNKHVGYAVDLFLAGCAKAEAPI